MSINSLFTELGYQTPPPSREGGGGAERKRRALRISRELHNFSTHISLSLRIQTLSSWDLAHQNRTIAIASDYGVDGAKSPEILQKEGVGGSEIAAQDRKSLAIPSHP